MDFIDETKKSTVNDVVDKLLANLDAKLALDSKADTDTCTDEAEAIAKLVDANARVAANDVALQKLSTETSLRAKELEIKLKEIETSFKLAEARAASEVEAAKEEARATKFAATMDTIKSIAGSVGTVVCTLGTIVGACVVMKASVDASGEDRVVDKNKVQAARDAVNTFFKFRL